MINVHKNSSVDDKYEILPDINVKIDFSGLCVFSEMIRSATPFPLVSLFFMFIGFILSNIGHIRPHRTILAFVSGIFFILSGTEAEQQNKACSCTFKLFPFLRINPPHYSLYPSIHFICLFKCLYTDVFLIQAGLTLNCAIFFVRAQDFNNKVFITRYCIT